MAASIASATSERPRPENGSALNSPSRSAEASFGASALASAPPDASIYSPSDIPDDSLNPRSCVTCRRRKVRPPCASRNSWLCRENQTILADTLINQVKCDKLQPCTNCRRAHIFCIFPAPGRAPRRQRPRDGIAPPGMKPHSSEREAELMKRLRKLEGIVEELSGQIEMEATRQGSSSESPEAATQDATGTARVGTSAEAGGRSRQSGCGPSIPSDHGQESPLSGPGNRGPPASVDPAERPSVQHGADPEKAMPNFNRKFGRLVLHDGGRSRYVSSGFWSKINDEVGSRLA